MNVNARADLRQRLKAASPELRGRIRAQIRRGRRFNDIAPNGWGYYGHVGWFKSKDAEVAFRAQVDMLVGSIMYGLAEIGVGRDDAREQESAQWAEGNAVALLKLIRDRRVGSATSPSNVTSLSAWMAKRAGQSKGEKE